jgi:hypothetical protein
MSTYAVEADLHINFDVNENGVPLINTYLYLGGGDDPTIEETISFADLFDQHIEFCSIPGGTMRHEHKAEAIAPLLALQEVLQNAINKIEQAPLWWGDRSGDDDGAQGE